MICDNKIVTTGKDGPTNGKGSGDLEGYFT